MVGGDQAALGWLAADAEAKAETAQHQLTGAVQPVGAFRVRRVSPEAQSRKADDALAQRKHQDDRLPPAAQPAARPLTRGSGYCVSARNRTLAAGVSSRMS